MPRSSSLPSPPPPTHTHFFHHLLPLPAVSFQVFVQLSGSGLKAPGEGVLTLTSLGIS